MPDEKNWASRLFRRVRLFLGPLAPPLIVIVAVLYSDGLPKAQTGLRSMGREVTLGWRVHRGNQ
jgi:hypothetical protein